MAQYKQCYNCGKSKETSEFSKCKARKDGLQDKCKACNKVDNLKFRTQINPEHHAEWQRQNSKRVIELVQKHRKADKSSKIYYIKNPIGQYYIGMTQAHLSVRWMEHKIHFRVAEAGKRGHLPGLHESFKQFGIDNHQVGTVIEFEDIDRDSLRDYESMFIKSFRNLGLCLNVRD